MAKLGLFALLMLLVTMNIAWAAVSGILGPLLGAAAYGVVAMLVLRSKDCRAAFVIGGIGFGLHLSRILGWSMPSALSEQAFLIANTVLPIGVSVFGLRCWRKHTEAPHEQ